MNEKEKYELYKYHSTKTNHELRKIFDNSNWSYNIQLFRVCEEIICNLQQENKELQDAIKNKDYLLKAQGKELKELYTENEQLENQLDFISEQNKYINKLETIITKTRELKHKWQKIESNSTLVFENDSLLNFMNELEDVLKGVNKDE